MSAKLSITYTWLVFLSTPNVFDHEFNPFIIRFIILIVLILFRESAGHTFRSPDQITVQDYKCFFTEHKLKGRVSMNGNK